MAFDTKQHSWVCLKGDGLLRSRQPLHEFDIGFVAGRQHRLAAFDDFEAEDHFPHARQRRVRLGQQKLVTLSRHVAENEGRTMA